MTRAPTLTLDELRAMGFTVDAHGLVTRTMFQETVTTGASGAVRSQPANTSAHPARRQSPISAPTSDAAPVPAPRRIIAIDPGYDRLAAVCLEVGQGASEPKLLGSFSQTSDASDAAARIDALLHPFGRWLVDEPMLYVGRAVIETPAIHGTYGRNRQTGGPTAIAAGMWKLGLATGAVLAVLIRATTMRVVTQTADRTRRDVKQARAGEYLARQGLTRTNDDLRSAAWIGLRYLSTTT